jgi:hypothetical protein
VVSNTGNGAASVPSTPSNAVTPRTAPGRPEGLEAAPAGRGQVRVSWSGAEPNGAPITGWSVRVPGRDPIALGAGAAETTVSGLAEGQNHTVYVRARNEAGEGPEAGKEAVAPGPPTVEITNVESGTRSITVSFTVDGHGAAPESCELAVNGGGTDRNNCSGTLKVENLTAATDYGFTVKARNRIGEDSKSATRRTAAVTGTVYCVNGPSGDQRTYCDDGVRAFNRPSQTINIVRKGLYKHGVRLEAVCYVWSAGENPPPDVLRAYIYNGDKRSGWWLQLPNGSYLPHIWLNLNGDRGLQPDAAGIRKC